MEFTLFILRWIHFLAGVTWIGILYYFNFVQTPFFAETEPAVRTGAVQKLLPRALWWFRWGAMFTVLAGLLIYIIRMSEMGGRLFYTSPYGVTITVGGLMGLIMLSNVWLVIWPNQQTVIASTNQVASGSQALPAAAGSARRAALASRTNTVFSIPMLFYMGAASHYPSMVRQSPQSGSVAGQLTWPTALLATTMIPPRRGRSDRRFKGLPRNWSNRGC